MYDELKFKMTSEKNDKTIKCCHLEPPVRILPVGNNVILNNINIKVVSFNLDVCYYYFFFFFFLQNRARDFGL